MMSDLDIYKEVSHQFDRESEVSLELLFASFCNHVTLGQWELARVCLRGLYEKRKQLNKPLKEILRALIDQPTLVSNGSPSVTSPFHLSWLCLVEYLHLFTTQEDKLPAPVAKTVEFRLLLYLTCKTAPKQIIQELDNYHCQIVYGDTSHLTSDAAILSSSCLLYLQKLLDEDPLFGHALVSKLIGPNKHLLETNQNLQQLYINCITKTLDLLESGSLSRPEDNESTTEFSKLKDHIYQILSLFNPTSDMTTLSETLDSLFEKLIKGTKITGPRCLDRGTLYSCLMQRQSTFLIVKFCDIENRVRLPLDGEFSHILDIGKEMIGVQSPVVSPFVQICLFQSYVAERENAWRYLFFHSMDKNHVLDNIVETALLFIKGGDFHKVTQLLNPPEFKRLKPLVLLLGWPYCYSCENARHLLDALWDNQAQMCDPLLYQACQKLAYQVQLVQWCLEKAGPLLASNESAGSTRHQQASEMFQGLESHSVLHVLHKSISLEQLPEKEVFSLLRKRPVFSPAILGKSKDKETPQEIAKLKADACRPSDLCLAAREEECVHPEVERDVILYHSFCGLKNFMECVASHVPHKLDIKESAESPSERTTYTNCKDSLLAKKLQDGREHLNHVYPLTYRVEILENIFSLLFATYEDLYEEKTHHESDDLDTGDDETKSMNTSLTGSMESLLSITSTQDITAAEHSGHFNPFHDQERLSFTPPLSTSTPGSPSKVKGHSRRGSHGSKRQLFQSIKSEFDPIPVEDGGKRQIESASVLDKVQRVRGLMPLEKTKTKQELCQKETKRSREQQDLSDEEPKIGFIASDEIVAQYLNVLKDCLTDLNTAKVRQNRSGTSDIRNSPDWLRSSVASSTLEQRASRLGQYITEAQWRHQLVSWTDTTKAPKSGKSRKVGRKYKQKRGRELVEDEAQYASDEDDDKGAEKPKGVQIERSDDMETRSEESSSYQSQEPTTGTEDNSSRTKVRQKRSKRPRQTRRGSVSEGLVVKDDSTVARMLSSPETLVFMCMRKDSYDRAQQVIKMFEMHDKPSAQAAVFAEKYSNAFKELSKLQPKSRQNLSRRGSVPSRTLGAVAMAAASGVTSTVVSNLIDELLTSPNLGCILLPDVDCQDEAVKKSQLYRFVSPELIPVMVCLDLACTVNTSWEICKSLVETANSRLVVQEDGTFKQRSALVGVVTMLTNLSSFLVPPTSNEKPKNKLTLIQNKPNLVDLLSSTRPLRYESREISWKRTKEQEESLKKMEQALEEGDTIIARVEDVASRGKTTIKSTGSLTSFKLVEKSLAVRVALTELQKAFDCVSGVDDVLREGSRSQERLDYLRTLINHVDTLATLLLHWQTTPDDLPGITDSTEKTRGVSMKASNPFVVLNKGIAETLGKPMFERSVSPKRLEGICKQLNINLVKVIVHNCCPHIPASGLGNAKVFRWPSSEPTVLNNASQWLEKARGPNVVAKELLTKMIDLLTGAAKSNDGLVDARSAAVITKSPEFHAIVQGTVELQRVDLDLLQTNESKMCFFINVLNLLFAHASLVHFSKSDDDEDWDPKFTLTRHGSLSRLSCTSLGSDTEEAGKTRGVSALDRISFLKHHCYDIGQIGPTSAFDILFVMLRAGIQPPTMFGPAIQLCYPERPVDDPKRKYKLSSPEKRIMFAICDGCISSPDLQVYDVSGLEAQLNAAVTTYVNPRITIDVAAGKIVLPEFLSWYKNDFTQGAFNDLEVNTMQSSQEPDINFLLRLEPFLLPNTAKQLQAVILNIKEVTYRPFCWTFGYKFEISSLDRSDSSSSLQRSSSVPDSLYLSMEYITSSIKSVDTRGRFNPNKATLEYLKKTSPLIFTLVELVCGAKGEPKSRRSSHDVISQEKTAEPQQEVRSKSPVSSETVFSSVLKRTSSFPALQRYLAARFYCLSELLVGAAVESDSETGSYEFVRLDSRISREDIEDSSPQIFLSSLALSADDAREQQYACQKTSDFYLRQGNFDLLLELISTSCFHGDGSGSRPVDFLLTSAVLSKGGLSNMFIKRLDVTLCDLKVPSIGFTHKWQKKPWSLLAQIKDNDHLAQLVLSKMREHKAKDASDMLSLALRRPPRNTALRKELEHRKTELNLHIKIACCAKTHQYITTDTHSFALLTQWQGVAVATPEEPDHVMNFLLSIQQYDLAADWAEMHALPHEFHKTIKESHLKHLLESSPEDTMKAYRILEGIQEQHMALEVCNSLLQQNLHVSQTLFIIQFMLTNLLPHLSPIRIEELLLTKMGAKALLCIPDMARPAYEHLVSRPNLLLEQLLMNLKVEWAARVFNRLQVDLAFMGEESDNDNGARHHGCTVKVFDELLARYAAKALEFQVVQAGNNQDTPTASQGFHPTPPASPTPSTASFGGGNTSATISDRETPTPNKEKITDQEYGRGSLNRSISSVAPDTFGRTGQQSYVPPAIPPRKEEWMPDEQALECIICKEPFSMFNRRHHCRRCGRVVCGNCSKHSCVVQGFGKTPVRVCETCYEHFYDKKLLKEPVETAHSSPASKSPARPENVGSLERSMAQESVVGSYSNSAYVTKVQADAKVANKWKLSVESENNVSKREEFYYEQTTCHSLENTILCLRLIHINVSSQALPRNKEAPSSSLCIAILDLHSDNLVCGRLLLDLCNTLSKKLVPVTPGVRNEEVDHNLIISMIRYLLFNAKLKMIKAGETQGVELCDTYLGHVDLMKFLVESNCGDIPSLQDLIHPDSARRLRDRFIEDERLTLAMEVSTKCGLDPSGVWAAAGFACLQAGDLAFARDKFAKCMKPTDGKQQQNSQYLDKMLDILQNSPLISFSQSTDELLSPLHGLAEHCKSVSHGSVLDSKRFDECLYYLHTYGNDTSIVAFYVRHGHIKLACRYILDKKSPPDVFVESLLMRLVSKGNLSTLKEQMEATDPSLQSWMTYLTAACRYLHKRGYHHLLYDIQLFMKDYFRAAQTCIRFFEGAAGGSVSTYEDLFSRLEYLSKARSHIETVIIDKKSPRGSALSAGAWLRSHGNMHRKFQDEMQHVTITLSDLNSHVNTINLQVEVTNFIHKCLMEGTNASSLRSNDDSKVPTLFGNGHARAELAIQVMLSGSTIQDGFSLASRIIQDYNLPASRVYVDAGRALARQYRFTHIQQLLKSVGEIGLVTDKCHDEIILACVRIVSTDQNQAKHVENLIKLLRSESNKIDAFLLCGKLKSAYLIAVREKRVEAIQLIAEEAQKTGQTKTLNLCKKWLAQNQKMKEAEERVVTQRRQDSNR